MRNVHVIPANREPVKGDILLRHLWKNTSNECISWWRYNETVVIDKVKQYTTLNGSFRDAVSSFKVQNIYITANGSFARGAYVTDGIEVMKATPKLVDAQGLINRRNWRKIVLTTDPELINDGVEAIVDEFLDWFVKNPSCEEVEVEESTLLNTSRTYLGVDKYKINIPKDDEWLSPMQKLKLKGEHHNPTRVEIVSSKNIHLIGTTEATRLHNTFNLLRLEKDYDFSPCNLNVYVTKEDEDIHDGDFIITKDGRLVEVSYLLSPDLEGASKVVLTSDTELTRDGVQSTDDDFLKWMVSNPTRDKVIVTNLYGDFNPAKNVYQIIIPQEAAEPLECKDCNLGLDICTCLEDTLDMDKESIEGCFLANIKYVLQFNNDAQAIRFMEKYFEAKKEQEGLHSENDIINAMHSVELKDNKNYSKIYDGMKKWFIESKNK